MTFIKAYEIRHECHPRSSEELSTASLYYCYSEVQTGSNGTEIRGRTTDPSLNLFTEYLLCQSGWFLSRAPRSCSMRHALWWKSVQKSMCSRIQRQQQDKRQQDIYVPQLLSDYNVFLWGLKLEVILKGIDSFYMQRKKASRTYFQHFTESHCSKKGKRKGIFTVGQIHSVLHGSASVRCSVMSDSCDPVDSSPPVSSVHGILQERKLEWVAIPSPGLLPDPGVEPGCPALHADSSIWATREAGSPQVE